MSKSLEFSDRELSWAIVLGLQMWSDDRYASILKGERKLLTWKWFETFIGDWRVARTLAPDAQKRVFNSLTAGAFSARVADRDVYVVDEYADRFQKNGWTSRTGVHKKPGRPVSLVSKMAFFLNPDYFVPLDSYGKGESACCARRSTKQNLASTPTAPTCPSSIASSRCTKRRSARR